MFFGRFGLSVGAAATVTDAGGVTGGAGGELGGEGGAGGGGDEASTGLTCLGTGREDGLKVADARTGPGPLRSAERATWLRPRGKSRVRGESGTETGLASLVSGGTPGGGPSACGTVVRRSDDTQTEAPTVAKAGTRGPIRSTDSFTSALATPP